MYSPPRHRIEVEDYTNFLHHLGNKFMVEEAGTLNIPIGDPD
jgi:hypothetical protein